jgi:hypothetical protein
MFADLARDFARTGHDEIQMAQLRALLACKRELLDRLHNDQWSSVESRLSLQYLKNCPPAGFVTYESSPKMCNRRLICPFCWGRSYVLEPFARLERFLYGSLAPQDAFKPRDDVWLLEFRRTSDATGLVNQYRESKNVSLSREGAIRRTLKRHGVVIKEFRHKEVKRWPNRGGFVLHRVVYKEVGYPIMYRCGLLVVEAGSVIPIPQEKDEAPFLRVQVHKTWLKKDLVKIFKRLSRFPLGWLTKADTEEVRLYLDQFSGLPGKRGARMFATYGCLRSKE